MTDTAYTPPSYRSLLESHLASLEIKRQRAHGLAARRLEAQIDRTRRELAELRRQQS